MEREIINFYSTKDKFGDFSNFAAYPIQLKKKRWPTVEHYFQAQKFAGTPYESKIRKAISPMQAAQLGRSRKQKLRLGWDKLRDSIMYDAVKAKFMQHQDLQTMLLDTESAILVEHTENDSYWGDGGNGKGKNKLGKILMQVREELRK